MKIPEEYDVKHICSQIQRKSGYNTATENKEG